MFLHLIPFLLLTACVDGFAPQPLLQKTIAVSLDTLAFPSHEGSLTPAVSILQNHNIVSSIVLAEDGGIIDIVRNIAVAATALIFLLAGLTFVTASIIIPAAAKELEKECMELAPELWDEYQGLLEPGQTIDQRPELMQELGAKLQPLLDAKMEKEFAKAKEAGVDISEDERAWNSIDNFAKKVPVVSPPTSNTGSNQVVDMSTMQNQWDDEDVIDVQTGGSDKK